MSGEFESILRAPSLVNQNHVTASNIAEEIVIAKVWFLA